MQPTNRPVWWAVEMDIGLLYFSIVGIRTLLKSKGDFLSNFLFFSLVIFKEYNPELVLVSAAFDSACGDPLLGECEVSPAGNAYMVAQLMTLANGKLILALEGGCNLHSAKLLQTKV